MSKRRDKAVLKIAKEHFDRDDLTPRNSDSLDFFEVSVLGIKAALEAAYEAGHKAGAPARAAAARKRKLDKESREFQISLQKWAFSDDDDDE